MTSRCLAASTITSQTLVHTPSCPWREWLLFNQTPLSKDSSVSPISYLNCLCPNSSLTPPLAVENEAATYLTGFTPATNLIGEDSRVDNTAYLAMMKAYTEANPALAIVTNQDRTSASLEDGDALLDGTGPTSTPGLFAPGVCVKVFPFSFRYFF